MRTFIAEIIPKIQKFSKMLDDLSTLTGQHWVSLGEIEHRKTVYIFRPNNQLLISENGIVKKGTWEYLGNQSLLLETENNSFLLKHGFVDENILALKLDSEDRYVMFINESKYGKDLNNIHDIQYFLETRYKNQNFIPNNSSYKELQENEGNYFVLSEMNEFGPYTKQELKNLIENQQLTRMNFIKTTEEKDYSKRLRIKDIL